MDYAQYVIPGLFVTFDIISGVIRAGYEGTLCSKAMRKGLFNKTGEIMALTLAKLLEYASLEYNLGINLPVYGAVVTYLIIMETLSIIENISALNENIGAFFSKFLKSSDWRE